MARSQNAFNKKEKEKKRLQKRKEKEQRKEERKANSQSGAGLEEMMAYVDENGNLMDTPPDPTKKKEEIKAENIEIGTPKKEEEDLNAERRGRVNFYDTSKGYGFINQDGTQERFFVHSSSLTRQIQEGDKVAFKVKKGLKGMEAISVKVLG